MSINIVFEIYMSTYIFVSRLNSSKIPVGSKRNGLLNSVLQTKYNYRGQNFFKYKGEGGDLLFHYLKFNFK